MKNRLSPVLLCCALALSLPAAADNEAKPTAGAKTPAKATDKKAAGTVDCPQGGGTTTAPAGSGGGVANSQGAADKGPVKPKCPGDVKPKAVQ